jgi:hypothetical protein
VADGVAVERFLLMNLSNALEPAESILTTALSTRSVETRILGAESAFLIADTEVP